MKIIILVMKSYSLKDGTETCSHPVYHSLLTAPAEPSMAAPPPDASPLLQCTWVAGGSQGLPSYHISQRLATEALKLLSINTPFLCLSSRFLHSLLKDLGGKNDSDPKCLGTKSRSHTARYRATPILLEQHTR